MSGRNTARRVIAISVAHSSQSPGAVSADGRYSENQWSADFSGRLGRALADLGANATVFDGSLGDAVRTINAMPGVSVAFEFHLNAAPLDGRRQPNYSMAYYAKGSDRGAQISRDMLTGASRVLPWPQLSWHDPAGTGVFLGAIPSPSAFRMDHLAFVSDTRCPAVIAEFGFITNPDHVVNLRDPAFLDRLARAVAESIQQWGKSDGTA